MSDAAIQASFRHRLGALSLEVTFEVRGGWTILFGPSGSGKSTVLRMIAGLMRPQSGQISILGRTAVDSERGLWMEPHQRQVRWAGQRTALFPRTTVRSNLALGLGKEGALSGRGWVDELERAIAVFGLGALADKYPAELSGGEQQRVSLVRAAIGARDKVLLLDEPFNGVDTAVRQEMIAALRLWIGDTPVLSVTHDVGEAFLLGAEIIRITDGKITAHGRVERVLRDERQRLLAQLGFGSRPEGQPSSEPYLGG